MTEATGRDAPPLAEQIMDLVRQGEVELPPYPDLAIRLQEMLAREDVAAADVAELVSNEPALVSSLMRIANSAAFRGLHAIKDTRQAIARLGLSQVGSIASALLVKGHFAPGDAEQHPMSSTLWDHAVTTAFAARELAEKIGADATQAFLGGLLHDCGNALVLSAVHHLQKKGLELEVTETLLEEMMTTLHCQLGHLALQTWNLPEALANVALHHEDPVEESEDSILLCVQAADCITRKLGFDLHPDPEMPLLQEPAIEQLGIEDMTLATLMVDLEDRLEELRQLF